MTWRHAPLALALMLSATTTPVHAGDRDYHEVLLGAFDLRDQALRHARQRVTPSSAVRRALDATNPDALVAITPHLPPAAELQTRLTRARARLAAAIDDQPPPAPRAKAFDYPEPDPLSDCIDASASAAQALLEAWSVSNEILAAAKWACLQTELGENGSEACTALAVETELLEGDLDRQSFCLGAQADATLAAFSQTQSNVVDFLNERADTTATSRATQTSVDALRGTLDSLLLRLTSLRAALVEDVNGAESGLDDVLDEALAVAAQLNALSADIADVRFRVQAVQVDVEDAQRRLADAQAEAARIAGDGARLRTALQDLRTRLSVVAAAQGTASNDMLDRRLAAALGDPGAVVLRYRLPAAQGGELERSREVLIRALTAYRALGIDTSTAQALLVTGDDAFNQGRPLDAYDAFARAYRALLGPAAVSVLIMRSSFE